MPIASNVAVPSLPRRTTPASQDFTSGWYGSVHGTLAVAWYAVPATFASRAADRGGSGLPVTATVSVYFDDSFRRAAGRIR